MSNTVPVPGLSLTDDISRRVERSVSTLDLLVNYFEAFCGDIELPHVLEGTVAASIHGVIDDLNSIKDQLEGGAA